MPNGISCWVLRNGKAKGPYPLRAVVAALKKGQLSPSDYFSLQANGPWADWPGFFAQVKVLPPLHATTPHEMSGVFRSQDGTLLLLHRATVAFPARCVFTNESSDVLRHKVRVPLRGSCALLEASQKQKTHVFWIEWGLTYILRVVSFTLSVFTKNNPLDCLTFSLVGVFQDWNIPTRYIDLEISISKSVHATWQQSRRRATQWASRAVGIALAALLVGCLLPAKGRRVLGLEGRDFCFLAIGACVVAAWAWLDWRRSRRLSAIWFNEEWIWLSTKPTGFFSGWFTNPGLAFIDSLKGAPIPDPILNKTYGRYEIPGKP